MTELTRRLLSEVNRLLGDGLGGTTECEDAKRLLRLCAREDGVYISRIELSDGRYQYIVD